MMFMYGHGEVLIMIDERFLTVVHREVSRLFDSPALESEIVLYFCSDISERIRFGKELIQMKGIKPLCNYDACMACACLYVILYNISNSSELFDMSDWVLESKFSRVLNFLSKQFSASVV